MLLNLHVKNLALIDEVDIDFDKGLIVITGETGAGKSILLNSIDVALGAKSTKELIKTGEMAANIEVNRKQCMKRVRL